MIFGKQAVDSWIFSYKERYFIRWRIFDKSTHQSIWTIEHFYRFFLKKSNKTLQ
jgi:hypothetical protein